MTSALNRVESGVYLPRAPTFNLCPTSAPHLSALTGCVRGCYFYRRGKKFTRGSKKGLDRPTGSRNHPSIRHRQCLIVKAATLPGSFWMVEVTIMRALQQQDTSVLLEDILTLRNRLENVVSLYTSLPLVNGFILLPAGEWGWDWGKNKRKVFSFNRWSSLFLFRSWIGARVPHSEIYKNLSILSLVGEVAWLEVQNSPFPPVFVFLSNSSTTEGKETRNCGDLEGGEVAETSSCILKQIISHPQNTTVMISVGVLSLFSATWLHPFRDSSSNHQSFLGDLKRASL